MRALLIEWNQSTGVRSGGVNPKDRYLQCHGWQNLDVEPAIELRIVEDERDLTCYDEVPGVTLIEGEENINAAIDANFPSQYLISDDFLFQEHFRQKNIDIDTLPDDRDERLIMLKDVHHLKGIRVRERQRCTVGK